MGRAFVWLAMSGVLLLADHEATFADSWGSSPFGIERGVRQRGRVRFRTGCGGGAWGSSPFGIERGVMQGGRLRFRSGCGLGGGWGASRRLSCGTPWWMIRQNLAYSSSTFRYVYVRNYFFRRYPYLYAAGTPHDGEEITVDHYLHPQYDVAANPLTTRQQLHLGAWQTWLGDYKEARASFENVVSTNPDHPEARWGLALCAVMSRNWKQAAEDLGRVAALGELDIDDELLDDVAFGEKDAVARAMKDLETATRYGYGNGDAHLVAAWLHLTQKNVRLAEIHLRKARRWSADNPAVRSLSEQLEAAGAPAEPESSPTPEAKPTPKAPSESPAPSVTVETLSPVIVARR